MLSNGMDEEIKKMEINELSDDALDQVSGGLGQERMAEKIIAKITGGKTPEEVGVTGEIMNKKYWSCSNECYYSWNGDQCIEDCYRNYFKQHLGQDVSSGEWRFINY